MKEPKNPQEEPKKIVNYTEIESAPKVPIIVNDDRNLKYHFFDLEKFLIMIQRLRQEDLFKLSKEFKDSDYGKYVACFASSESNSWERSIKTAKYIEINLITNPGKIFELEYLMGMTNVEIKVLMDDDGTKKGRIFNFLFDQKGNYYNGRWKDVDIKKIQEKIDSNEKEDQNPTLTIQN